MIKNSFSDFFEIDIASRPVVAQDKPNKINNFYGIALGCGFIILTFAAFFSGFFNFTFDWQPLFASPVKGIWLMFVFILVGFSVALANYIYLFNFNEFEIGKKFITVKRRNIRGISQQFMTSIKSYLGVHYRTAIKQKGRIAYTQHILELLHSDNSKNIPLYASFDGRGVWKKWEKIVRTLELPAVITTAEGLETRKISDLGKTIKRKVKEGIIEDKYDPDVPFAKGLSYKQIGDNIVFKPKKMIGSIDRSGANLFGMLFPIIAILFMIVLLVVTSSADQEQEVPFWLLMPPLGLALAVAIGYPLIMAIRMQTVVVAPDYIRIFSQWPFSGMDIGEDRGVVYPHKEIRGINIFHNIDDKRHYLVISSDENTSYFGKDLSYEDMVWLKDYLISAVAD